MNKGKAFELRAFKVLGDALQSNSLGLDPGACQIFHRKKYFSSKRASTIEIDVSIEVYLPGAPNWSLLWAWECKNYKRPVPVDDVEEFCSKLTQIAGMNVKGGLVVSGVLQAGALSYARAMGITVVRLLPQDQIHYPNCYSCVQPSPDSLAGTITDNDKEVSNATTMEALTKPGFRSEAREFFGLIGTKPVTRFSLVEDSLRGIDELKKISGIFVLVVESVSELDGIETVFGGIRLGKIRLGEKLTFINNDIRYNTVISWMYVVGRRQGLHEEANAGDLVDLRFLNLPKGVLRSGSILRGRLGSE